MLKTIAELTEHLVEDVDNELRRSIYLGLKKGSISAEVPLCLYRPTDQRLIDLVNKYRSEGFRFIYRSGGRTVRKAFIIEWEQRRMN